ncbi:unnamed protein product (macronuclear) [Paramecium tetraurelia]|uniref:Rab-GAP TBC domain-containing protein n=1 Tax=Paramecium tetraurelia TaxID=5888 RepID=A0BRS9_PARTE|nr:uncharacterized protein GSPATT00031477001 [Paramecium tetraurelia]CAK61246.1 unnamed protein product [Paramecium tetraurelia]|eukprot:XP_001428644.1 hypothetical protein (macronuclear) [Paramecium tetraurelia strain d4-2]
MDDMHQNIIQPYEDFSANYFQTNSTLIIKAKEFLKQVQTQRESLFNKQQVYLKTAYDLEKKKNSKQLQSKADELFVDYRQELTIVNQLWHIFNEKFKSQFDEYDQNELARTQLTKTTSENVVSHISKVTNILNSKLQQVLASSNEKFSLIHQKHSNEKQPVLKNIMRNRTFNVFKVTKQDNFITYEDWIANINSHDKFDPINLQKFKLTQQMEQQINILIDLVQQAKTQDYNKQQFQSVLDIDFETLFQCQDTRIKLLDSIIQIIDQAPTDVIVINPSSNDLLILIAKHLILNLQKDQNFNVVEFNQLLNFITQFGMREKNQFIAIGQQASEKTFLFYEKNKWQQLLLYLNEKENMSNTNKCENHNQNNSRHTKPKKTQIINLLYQKKRIINEKMTQEQRLNYLKVLLNLQKICSIMLKLDIKIDYASETIIILSKMCNIRVQDIVLLLEQFESIKIYMEQIQPQSPKTQQLIMEKKRLFYTLKKCLKYLSLSDQLTIVQINKEFSQLSMKIKQRYLCLNNLTQRSSIKRKLLWTSLLQPESIQLDYYKLKEKYSKQAGVKEATLEHQIAQDVQRSFNSGGQQSKINHLTLHNLLKLYAYYNNTISYTQGMNFVMGFIYTIMIEEELTFRCFAALINQLLKDVLLYDLKYIRVFFYKLDRILAIFMPKIHQHLKEEKIEAGHYSAPWFITLFTGSFMKNEFSTVLFDIWDVLLSRGWCGFYQIILGIFQTYEDKILSMKFDVLLQFLNNLSKAEFFTQNTDEIASLKTLKYRALKFKVTNKMIEELDKEYYLVRQKINNLMNS